MLEGAITLAHLAGAWPLRLSAISDGAAPGRRSVLLATCLGAGGATGGLTVLAAAGAPARRVRVVTPAATLLLEERGASGTITVDAEGASALLPVAAGAEATALPEAGLRFHVPVPLRRLAVVERFLRRNAAGGADDLATLVCGLTLTERLWESARDGGEVRAVGYRRDVRESPRFRMLRGGRADAPADASAEAKPRPLLTVVR